MNFGVLYGMSDYGLSRDTGLTRKEAAEFIESYFQRYGAVKDLLRDGQGGSRGERVRLAPFSGGGATFPRSRLRTGDSAVGGANGDKHADPGHRR